jgi:hypothetical protein
MTEHIRVCCVCVRENVEKRTSEDVCVEVHVDMCVHTFDQRRRKNRYKKYTAILLQERKRERERGGGDVNSR